MTALWQAARRQHSGFWVLLALACLGEGIWFTFINVGFFCDTIQYLRYANVMLGIEMPYQTSSSIGQEMDVTSVSRRTAGYPLLLILGGVPFANSLIGIIVIQGAMAVAMPLLVYKTLEPYGRRAAFMAGLILIISLEPFSYSKAILSDHSFKFLLLLLVYLASRAYRTPSRPLLAGIVAVSIFLALVRPQGALTAVVVFVMLIISYPRRYISLASHFIAVVVGLGLCSFGAALYLASYVPREIPAFLQRGDNRLSGQLQNLLFYHLYNSQIRGTAALAADKGLEREKLRSAIQAYAKNYPQEWVSLPPKHYFGAFADNPSGWVDEIYRNPNPYYLNMIKVAVAPSEHPKDRQLNGTADDLFWRVIRETYWNDPKLILSFVSRYFLGSATSSGIEQSWSQFYTAGLSPFRASNGPASKEIMELSQIYITDFPGYAPRYMENYPGGIGQLVEQVFTKQPDEGNWFFFWGVTDQFKGRLASGEIFLKSMLEYENFYYLKTMLFFDKISEAFIGTPSGYRTGKRIYDDAGVFLSSYPDTDVPARIRQEIVSGMQPMAFNRLIETSPHYSSYLRWYTIFWLAIRDIANLAIATTLLFCLRSDARWMACLIGFIIVYNNAVIAAAADTYIRYLDAMIPLSIMLAGLSVGTFTRTAFVFNKS